MPSTLKDLGRLSSLIVVGTVKTTPAPRETSPGSLETDAVISINTVLKGPNFLYEIVISQLGGDNGQLVITPADYLLVQPGDKYLLFLRADDRSNVPSVQRPQPVRSHGCMVRIVSFRKRKNAGRGKQSGLVAQKLREPDIA